LRITNLVMLLCDQMGRNNHLYHYAQMIKYQNSENPSDMIYNKYKIPCIIEKSAKCCKFYICCKTTFWYKMV